MQAPLPEYTISGSYSSDRHGELVCWALRADQLLPCLYGNYYQSLRIRLSSDMILKGPGMERQHSDSVLILFKEGLGKDNRQAVLTAFVREVSTV